MCAMSWNQPGSMPGRDDGKWLEAVASKCLADDSSPSEARDFVLGYVISQLLWFWRHPIPEPWGTLSERWEFVGAMKLVYEPGRWAAGDQFDEDLMPHREQVYDALRRNVWEAYAALPEAVWGWLAELTGLSREHWEALPDQASHLLSSTIICPVCGADGTMKQVARASSPNNPHFVGSRLDIHCVQCASPLRFDVSARRVRKMSSNWIVAMIVVLVVVLGGLILSPLLSLLHGPF